MQLKEQYMYVHCTARCSGINILFMYTVKEGVVKITVYLCTLVSEAE